MTDRLADTTHPLIGQTAIWVMAAYLVVLIVLGLMGRFARKEASMGDFFLGGRSLGFVVLLLTLYATQYSGNTMIGFTAGAYRSGFKFLVSVVFMMSVIGAYVLFAPQLYRQGRRNGYITLSDYIQDRFRNRTLSVLISVSGIVGLGNYLITNLKAIGEMSSVMSGGLISQGMGIVLLAIVILVYETLGGLRSVAWTDVLQGLLLFIGCLVIFATIFNNLGGLEGAADRLRAVRPDFWHPPDISDCLSWSSTTLIVSFGIAMYPHAIQRIYAARSGRTLKRSLQIMVFMPLATTLLMVTFGILGNIPFPSLDRDASEGITCRRFLSVPYLPPSCPPPTVRFFRSPRRLRRTLVARSRASRTNGSLR
jgi:SSS family solute:Na+ symporter